MCSVKLLFPMGRGNSKERKGRRLRLGPVTGERGEKSLMLAHPPVK